MNYKTNIPVYTTEDKLTEQLTLILDSDMYERIEKMSMDTGLSMNKTVKTLLDHALKHCTI